MIRTIIVFVKIVANSKLNYFNLKLASCTSCSHCNIFRSDHPHIYPILTVLRLSCEHMRLNIPGRDWPGTGSNYNELTELHRYLKLSCIAFHPTSKLVMSFPNARLIARELLSRSHVLT